MVPRTQRSSVRRNSRLILYRKTVAAVSCNSVHSTLRLQCRTYGLRAESAVLKLALDFRVLRSKEMSTQGETKKNRKDKIKKRKKDRKKTEDNKRKINEGNIKDIEGSKCDFRLCWHWLFWKQGQKTLPNRQYFCTTLHVFRFHKSAFVILLPDRRTWRY